MSETERWQCSNKTCQSMNQSDARWCGKCGINRDATIESKSPTRFYMTIQLSDEMKKRTVKASYHNHRSEVAERTFLPLSFGYMPCQCHGDQPAWCVVAWDFDRNDIRTFAMDHFTTPWRSIDAEG